MTDIRHYIGNADEFPILRQWDFFNHAGVAPVSHACAEALRRFAGQAEGSVYLQSNWYVDIEKLRASTAKLINAHRDEIAFVKNTSEGISIVANGIEWQWGDRIISTAVEYPANIYPWMEVARARGAKLVLVPEQTDENGRRHVPLARILEAASDPQAKVVSISHVEFASGQRHDLARIGEFCRANDKLFCVDAIQSVGVLPVDVEEMKIDFLSADGHKWLMGPEGAGIFYCRRSLIERTRPVMVGWMNVIDAQEYGNYDYTLRSDAGRFECGSHNVAGLMGLKASLELLGGVGTGKVAQRIRDLTDRLVDGLLAKGYHVVSPRDKWQWSAIVSFTCKDPTQHEPIFKMLRKDHKTEIALREGRLRVSPHFYNTDEQIDRLLNRLPEE